MPMQEEEAEEEQQRRRQRSRIRNLSSLYVCMYAYDVRHTCMCCMLENADIQRFTHTRIDFCKKKIQNYIKHRRAMHVVDTDCCHRLIRQPSPLSLPHPPRPFRRTHHMPHHRPRHVHSHLLPCPAAGPLPQRCRTKLLASELCGHSAPSASGSAWRTRGSGARRREQYKATVGQECSRISPLHAYSAYCDILTMYWYSSYTHTYTYENTKTDVFMRLH